MSPRRDSPLEYALLGLLLQRPCSGYDLKKIFSTTPMGRFSDSPGSIYPALKRLERTGLIRGAVDNTRPLRPRRVFRLTPKGRTALESWAKGPVEREDLVRRGEELMLRFAFMETLVPPTLVIRFLEELRAVIGAYVAELERHSVQAGHGMLLHGRLALEAGIEGHRAHGQWAGRAIKRIRREQALSKRQKRRSR